MKLKYQKSKGQRVKHRFLGMTTFQDFCWFEKLFGFEFKRETIRRTTIHITVIERV